MDVKPLKWALSVSVLALLAVPAWAQTAAQTDAATAAVKAPAQTAPAAQSAAPATDQATPTPLSNVTAPLPSAVTEPAGDDVAPAAKLPAPAGSVTPGDAAAAAPSDLPPATPDAQVNVKTLPEDKATAGTLSNNECEMALQEITTLREPEFSSGNAWDLVDGGDGMDVFTDVIPLDKNMTVVAGAFTKDKEDKTYHPLIVKYDERLKKVWEVHAVTADYKTVHRILKTKQGYTVLGDVQDKKRGNGIYIAFYDENGKPKGEAPIYEDGGNLDSKSLIMSSDAAGYIIAAQYIDAKDDSQQHGILYKVTKSGQRIWKRSYQPGMTTVFQNVQPTLDGQYLLTGQIITENNKSGGWMMRIDNKGAIGWQRTYPRGLAASIQGASQFKDGSILVSGKIRPLSGTDSGLAAWVMKTDSTGTPLWQRYFKSPHYDYGAADSIVYEDGRASVLITGAAIEKGYRSHARLMTFSPRGHIQSLEDFTEGQNANANRLVVGLAGERIITGYAQTSFGDHQEGDDAAPEYTYDGWIVAGVPLDLYSDPCVPPKQGSPILP